MRAQTAFAVLVALDHDTMRHLGEIADRTTRGSIPEAAAALLTRAVAESIVPAPSTGEK